MNRDMNQDFAKNAAQNLPASYDAEALEPAEETAESIALFRGAMHSIAERETARPVNIDWLQPARRRRRQAQGRMIMAWACAAGLCFAVVPRIAQNHSPEPPVHVAAQPDTTPATPAAAKDQTEDTAFLEQVDNAISEPVPSSLAPLEELDSWNSTTSTNHSEKKNVTE